MLTTHVTLDTPSFLTVEEAAKRLRISRPTMYRLVRAGILPAVRIGDGTGPIRIPTAELNQWLTDARITGGQQ